MFAVLGLSFIHDGLVVGPAIRQLVLCDLPDSFEHQARSQDDSPGQDDHDNVRETTLSFIHFLFLLLPGSSVLPEIVAPCRGADAAVGDRL